MKSREARYIADYINEELSRGNTITSETILEAVDAFEGGAADTEEDCTCSERSWYGKEHDSECPLAGQPYNPLELKL